MAKKDRLKSLLGGIGESPEERKPQPQQEELLQEELLLSEQADKVAKDIIDELGISSEMEEQLNLIRKKKVGRPSGRKNGNPKPKENRATFIVDRDITRKLKYIALMETKLYKNIVSEALNKYIEQWEKKNGVINLPNTKEDESN